MKIVQSLWTKPLLNRKDGSYSRSNGGWLSEKDYLLALSYSSLKLKRHYPDVELVTDKKGKELLIDMLGLPYSDCHICLDQFNNLSPLMWVVPKVFSYSVVDTPFLHVDNDVFIWGRFPRHIEVAELAVQNMEVNFDFYYDALDYVKNFRHLPKYIASYKGRNDSVTSVNAGIIGGSDYDFYQEYISEVLEFLKMNKDFLNDNQVGKLTVIIDQFFFYSLALEKNKKITPLIDTVSPDYLEALAFYKTPILSKFIHAVGGAKKDPLVSELVSQYLRYEFPEVYNTIEKIFADHSYHLWAGGSSKSIPAPPVESDSSLERESSGLESLQNVIANIKNKKLRTNGAMEEIANLEQVISDFSTYNSSAVANDLWFKRFCEAQDILTSCSLEELLNKKFVLAENHRVIELSFPLENSQNNGADPENSHQDQYIYLMRFNKKNKFEATLLSDLKILLYYFSEGPIAGNEIIEMLKEDYGDELSADKIRDMVFTLISQSLLYDNSLSPV